MTNLFDQTVQGTGWCGPTFAAGECEHVLAPAVTGLSARSFWVSPLNGVATDVSLGFCDAAGNRTSPAWINVHTGGAQTGVTVPSPQLIDPSSRVLLTTRVPGNADPYLVRAIVSDQGSTPPPSDPPCKYGTEAKSGAPGTVILTAETIQAALDVAGFGVLNVLFAPLIGLSLGITGLCSSQPPVFPALSANLTENSIGELLQAFSSIVWSQYCQCVPGTPPAINFPPPQVVVPPGLPTAPVFPCDPANLCLSIQRIETLLNQVAGQVGRDLELTTLLQRYSLPFGVVPSNFHSGLTGQGSVPVERLIGVQYQVDQLPANVLVRPGAPLYFRDLGWIGLELPSGGVVEHRVTRQQELWMPDEAQLGTILAWDLTPGTEITIRELKAET